MRQRIEPTPTASVVIPVHNAADVVSEQLEALCGQVEGDRLEVIVVLNRCSDGSEDVVRAFGERLDLTVVTADRLASAAYARNAGAAAVRSNQVLFCDADDRVSATWARDLVGGLRKADFVGGRILVDRNGLSDWAYRYFYANKESGLRVLDDRIPYPLSACMAIHKTALFTVNGFDETFAGASGEETDLAIRLLRAGFRVGFVDGAVVHYRPRTSFRDLSRQQRERAFSTSRLSLREGAVIPRPSVTRQVYRTTRRLGRRVLLERTVHPLALASDVVVGSAQYAAAKWASTATEPRYDTDPEVLDFVAELGTPVIGGLAFRANRSTARTDSLGNEIRRTTLTLLDRLLAPGDVVVDVGATIGLTTVAVARMVETSGRVIALETDAGARHLLRSNLSRHGCERVDVPDIVSSRLSDAVNLTLGSEPDAIVVATLPPSESDDTARRLAAELRASGLHWSLVESGRNGATVRALQSDGADRTERNGTACARTVIAVPTKRLSGMVEAVAWIRNGADLQAHVGEATAGY